jgi:hypothetical protein
MSNPVGPSRLLTLDGAIDSGQLAGIDACVNLAGVGVGNHSWTEGYKALIRSSRVPGTRALAGVLAGTQAWSWISLSDEVAATRFLLGRPDLRGPVNLTAPGPVTNAAFTAALDHALHRPDLPWLRAPAWLLRAALGESIGDVLINAQAPATGSAPDAAMHCPPNSPAELVPWPVSQVHDLGAVPRPLPPGEREQTIDNHGCSPPDEHSPHPEGGRQGTYGHAHHQPRGRIGQFCDADPCHRSHLARINGRDRARPPPPGEHRDDPEAGGRDEQLGKGRDDINAVWVNAHLLGGLPQRRCDRPVIVGVDGPARERRLTRVQPQSPAALDEEQIRAVPVCAEQDQYG